MMSPGHCKGQRCRRSFQEPAYIQCDCTKNAKCKFENTVGTTSQVKSGNTALGFHYVVGLLQTEEEIPLHTNG